MTDRLAALAAAVMLAVTLLASLSSKALVGATGWRWLTKYPAAWEARLDRMISAAMKWLVEDAALRDARLALALATRQVLANGLDLLGVSAPERM